MLKHLLLNFFGFLAMKHAESIFHSFCTVNSIRLETPNPLIVPYFFKIITRS